MRDAIGNEVNVGDAVHVKVGNDWIMGRVKKIQNGGIAMLTGIPKNGQQVPVTPDILMLEVQATLTAVPGSFQGAVLKIVAPQVDVNESALKM